MHNKNLPTQQKEKIRKLLIKEGIINEKVLEVRHRMLEFWNKEKKVEKPTEEEKEILVQLKDFCKGNYDENLQFTEKIFKLLKGLLNSSNPIIYRKALKMTEKLIEKYQETAVEQLQKITSQRK